MLRYVWGFWLVAFQFSANASDPEILWLPFDEQSEIVSDRNPERGIQAELLNVEWARGEFGEALSFGGTNSFVEMDALPALRNADSLSLSIWVMWQGDTLRSYPNLLTSRTWSPGGMMLFVNQDTCSFRLGKPDAKGVGWQEVGVSQLNKLPKNSWTHLCVTFDRPQIITYVNGKKIASAQWDFPVQCDALRLGGWHNPVCHAGLMDDLRIYSRALSEQEVAALAADAQRSSAAYTVHDSKPLPVIAEFENSCFSFALNQCGRLAEMYSKTTERSLLSRSTALVCARLDTGDAIRTCRVEPLDKNRLRFYFREDPGWVELRISEQSGFFDIEVLECTLKNVEVLTFFEVASALTTYRGEMANMLSDETEGICLRGYDLPIEMSVSGDNLRLQTTRAHGLTGWRGGLAVAPRAELPGILQRMTRHAGVPFSVHGGAWSLASEANRGSYLFADLSLASVEEWIELAQRCGYQTIHLHGWWERLGHYPVNRNLFPKGEEDLKEAVQRIHAAGLTAGIHTLTACIDPQDGWVTPKPHPDLLAAHVYTLSRELAADATVVYVEEMPVPEHDTVFTYSGNGNALRIGDEIIRYTRISRVRPYGFLDCERGAFGTAVAAHPGGAAVDYLQQRYYAFYPKPDSALAEELAQRLGHIFTQCNFDSFYFDGSEGMRSRYGIDSLRHAIMKRLGSEAQIEASCHGAHNWWFHSRLGAWDHPVWGMKSFHDLHLASARSYRQSDLLATQLGWWAPRPASAIARGHYLEEMEYFACKNMAFETASSIQGVNVSHAPLPYAIERQMTLLGWYERLRRARYFDRETLQRIAAPGQEFELRQGPGGLWQFSPVVYALHRAGSEGECGWQMCSEFADQPVALRIAALQRALPYGSHSGVPLLDAAVCAELRTATASPLIDMAVTAAQNERFAGAFRVQAANRGSTPLGAWASASRSFAPDYLDISACGAVGLWVQGDGSGALLNVQLESPREHMQAFSEHYVTLDFKGWRYCELHFKERDTRLHALYQWPYSNVHALYRTALNVKYLSSVNIYLNNIPAGGSTAVVLSPVMALPVNDSEVVNPAVQINGETLTLPVTLRSGDFIELDSAGQCVHYNRAGDPVAELAVVQRPVLRHGTNTVHFSAENSSEKMPRAEITLISKGVPFGGMNAAEAMERGYLKRHYEMPVFIRRERAGGYTGRVTVAGDRQAAAEIELHGPVSNPVLLINGVSSEFAVDLKSGERLICRDRQNWRVIDSSRKVTAVGMLPQRIPWLNPGPNTVGLQQRGACAARLNIVYSVAE